MYYFRYNFTIVYSIKCQKNANHNVTALKALKVLRVQVTLQTPKILNKLKYNTRLSNKSFHFEELFLAFLIQR